MARREIFAPKIILTQRTLIVVMEASPLRNVAAARQ
jgi:hypothetical protein